MAPTRRMRIGVAALTPVLIAAGVIAVTSHSGASATTRVPAQLLKLSNWNLVLPVGSSGTASTVTDSALSTYSKSPWFTADSTGSGVLLRAKDTGVAPAGEQFAQTQLREAANASGAVASWSSTQANSLTVRQAVTHLPPAAPALVVATIHAKSAAAGTDLLQVRADGRGQTAGTTKFCVRFNGSSSAPCWAASYRVGTAYTLGISVTKGTVAVSFNGTVRFQAPVSGSGLSFRVGTMLLTNAGAKAVDYGETELYSLALSHGSATTTPTSPAPSASSSPTPSPTRSTPSATPTPSTSTTKPSSPAPSTSTPKPTPSASSSSPVSVPVTSGGKRWTPTPGVQWQWQLSSTPTAAELATAYQSGARAFDIDGDDATSASVAAIHALGSNVGAVCYIDVGGWEDYRSDAAAFPDSVKGSIIDGWPSERWLDVRQISVLKPLMQARVQMCAAKGFDAVEPDLLDGYSNSTGFPITAAEQLTYDEMIAGLAHSAGLSVTQKGDIDQAAALEPYFDWTLNEQCGQYNECDELSAYQAAGKAVWIVEYSGFPSVCGTDYPYAGAAAMEKDLNLTASPRTVCSSKNG